MALYEIKWQVKHHSDPQARRKESGLNISSTIQYALQIKLRVITKQIMKYIFTLFYHRRS